MPFQRLFTRRSVRIYSNQSKEMVMEKVANFWRQNQFYVSFPAPFQMHAEQFFTRIGLRRVADVWIYDQGNDVAVDLSFSATLGDTEAAVGLVGAVLLLPVTAVVGAVSYLDYQSDADQLVNGFWNYMGPYTIPQEPQQGYLPTCKTCGTSLDWGSNFCRNCGVKVEPPPAP